MLQARPQNLHWAVVHLLMARAALAAPAPAGVRSQLTDESVYHRLLRRSLQEYYWIHDPPVIVRSVLVSMASALAFGAALQQDALQQALQEHRQTLAPYLTIYDVLGISSPSGSCAFRSKAWAAISLDAGEEGFSRC